MITKRQTEILDKLIGEYIDLAKPISSQLLEKKHDFGVCSATLRNEMQELTEKGFLCQPHTSAGRIPTDKGYRFFVDRLFERDEATHPLRQKVLFASLRHLPLRGSSPTAYPNFAQRTSRRAGHTVLSQLVREITRFLAEESSNLALSYWPEEEIVWKEGWGRIFQEPEFSEVGFAAEFGRMINDFEENVESIISPDIQVYIGREAPFSEAEDFSIITTSVFAILGPKRMDYNKNINLLKSATKWLKKK